MPSKPALSSNLNKQLSTQNYTSKPIINGVKVIDLSYFSDDGGYFLELGRWQEHIMEHLGEFELKQMNYSEMDPGTVKAWHLHFNQEDVWFVPPTHKLLVALRDCREDSKTKHVMMRLVLGAGKAKLLYIPRGVAHGAANLWKKPAGVIYFMNSQFNPDPKVVDEYRLPWDQFGKEIWEITKG